MTEKNTMNNNVTGVVETVESHLHPTPSWDLADHPMPTGREEIWRFTPIKRLAALLAENETAENLNWQTAIPQGVTFDPISLAEGQKLAVAAPSDRVSALAAKQAQYSTRLVVPAAAEIADPIILTGVGAGAHVCDHTIIEIGAHARATIVFHYQGSATFAEKTDIRVGDGAQLMIISLQDWNDDAVHGGQRSVLIGRDAQVQVVTASLGADVIRLQEDATYAGPGGSLEQYGIYFVDAGQHVEHRVFVDHNQPKTSSNVDYRGALQGKSAHSVWIGDVLIRKAAEGIETYEANKNLVLTDGCQADSVPNLEIETGEIAGAGHSSTTGRFDENHLFYLRSRGIEEKEARRMIVHGFFVDLIRRIGIESVEQRLLEVLDEELKAVSL